MKTKPKTKACNHCGKQINVQSRNCPFCAGRIKTKSENKAPRCPHCNVRLKGVFPPDHQDEYDICSKCGGMWLDKGEFHLATRKMNVYQSQKKKGEYFRGAMKDSLKYVPCVRCGEIMNRKNFARISGVMIDQCGDHGVWLDPGELEKIQHFIADGGLDRSRDREIEVIRNDLKEMATKVNQVAFSHRLIHFWSPKRWLFTGFR